MRVIAAGVVASPIVLGAAPKKRPVVVLAGLRGAPGAGGGSAGVSSFNSRTGTVTLTGDDVTTALAYTPANAASLSAVALSGSYSDLLGLPSFAAVALSGAYGDLAGLPFIPGSPGDIGAATAAQGALADTAVQPGALSVQLDLKVDKVAGYGLSQENFTAAEKAKLAGLEGSHYRGTFINLTALQTAIPAAQEGDYADVDAGAGAPVQRYIWDESDSEWVAQAGSADPITAAQVKTLYESNPDTNAYTDSEKSKLGGIAAGATANANTDSLAEGATNLYHTAARVLATVLSGLSLATGGAITSADTVLVAFGKLQKQITDLITTVSGKQDTLVSGTSIKTINGESVLGSGNIVVEGGGTTSVVGAVGATFDGGSEAIATDSFCDVVVPFGFVADRVSIVADAVGDISIDIRVVGLGDFPPTGAESITGGANPGLSASDTYIDTALTGWSKTITAGDVVRFVVVGTATVAKCNIVLSGVRS